MTTPKPLTALPFRLAKGLRAIAKGEPAFLAQDEVDRLVAEGLIEPDRKLAGWGCEWVARDRQKSTVVFTGLGNHQIGRREPAAHELAADPDGHGLDAEETAAYQLAARCYSDGRLAVPDGADDREALWRLFNDIANAEDGDAENRRLDPETCDAVRALEPGDEVVLGGGACPQITVRRRPERADG